MYVPRHFAEHRDDVVVALVRDAAFGHLVVAGSDGIVSTPMPFVVDDELTVVRAHLARPNRFWTLAPCDALLIVPVTDAYISPSWYPSKAEHGKVVPTWNYEVVHLHGQLTAHDDPDWLDRQLRDLTAINESTLPAPWSVEDAPTDFIATSRRAIVGVELAVGRVDAKRKLSQNRSSPDAAGAIDGLRRRGDGRSVQIARVMDDELRRRDVEHES